MTWSISLATIILASAVPITLVLGYFNRQGSGTGAARGIGWQFIRYTVIATAIPVVGVLALNGTLSAEAATIISGALGFAFGQKDGQRHKSSPSRGGSVTQQDHNDQDD